MPIQVLMPQLGEAIEEAIITKWLKSEGDAVEEFDPLVEVNTDKIDTEIPSPTKGTLLKILKPDEGSIVEVGMLLAWIGEPGEVIPEDELPSLNDNQSKDQNAENIQSLNKTPRVDLTQPTYPEDNKDKITSQDLGFISPVVAKIAAEYDINLELISGTGLNGRITKKDVLKFLDREKLPDSQELIGSLIPDIEALDTVLPHTPIRRRIAEHMAMSKRISPHVTTVFEADMSKIVAHRALNKDAYSQDGVNLTFTAYFIQAVSIALKSFPMVNSTWSEEGLLLHRDINVGMATSLGEQGLIVPVIKNADDLSLIGIARKVNDLANRARIKQLKADEVAHGTFTITNHGMSGSLFAMPIINQPQCAILGVGKIQKRVFVLEDLAGYDTISIRPMVYLTLTFDHRILDGAQADYFLSMVVTTLENWT